MPVLARAFLLFSLAVLAIGSVVVGIAKRRVERVHDLAPPPITRATDPGEIARGERLFRTDCLDCHAGASGRGQAADATVEPRPVGARVTNAPEFLGEIWAPNLTSDPVAGIGAWTDGELARLLRNGLRRDGRYAGAMPRFGRLGDLDVAALIGFLRSDSPLVAATPTVVPRARLGLAGTLALAFAAGVDTRGDARVPVPARAATASYGRYLATAVYGCVDCHTDGYASTDEKLGSPALLAGGLAMRTPHGEPIYSSNLTPDAASGIGAWALGDLQAALTTGIARAGWPLRPPMPVFRYVDATEVGALFAFLRLVPARERRTPAGPPRERIATDSPPDRLFAALGCACCHGEGAPDRFWLKRAASEPLGAVAASIRHPEARHPGSRMPTYAAILDERAAASLARWIADARGAPSSP